MVRNEAIGLLEQELAKIEHLRGLPCDDDSDNKDFKLLRYNVRDIIEVAFNKDSSEYRRIPIMSINTLTFEKTEEERKQEYNKSLDSWELYLESIIQKYEKLGFENTTVANDKRPFYQKAWYEVKDFIASVIAKFLAEKTKST
jgi:uncharacterized protein YqfB (UPF0267 family)